MAERMIGTFTVSSGLLIVADPSEEKKYETKRGKSSLKSNDYLLPIKVENGRWRVSVAEDDDRLYSVLVHRENVNVDKVAWSVGGPLHVDTGLALVDAEHYRNDDDAEGRELTDIGDHHSHELWYRMARKITDNKAYEIVPGGVIVNSGDGRYTVEVGQLPKVKEVQAIRVVFDSDEEEEREGEEEGSEGALSDAEVEVAEIAVGKRRSLDDNVEVVEGGLRRSEAGVSREGSEVDESGGEAEEGESDAEKEIASSQRDKDVKTEFTVYNEGDEVVVTVPYYIEHARSEELYNNGGLSKGWEELFSSVRNGYRPPKTRKGNVAIGVNEDLDVLEFRFQGYEGTPPLQLLDHVRSYIERKEVGFPFGSDGDVLYLGIAPKKVGKLMVVYD